MTRKRAALHAGLFAACCVTTTWLQGPVFAATLMGILTCHELGHYIAARIRGVPASLPYFIPLPFAYGTMGAVIQMDDPIQERDALFDVGAAGPIAGLLVAIPLLVVGLEHSALGPLKPGDSLEGNSIFYALLKHAVFGRWLPSGGVDVQLGPMAEAAWFGILVTMINLIPIGQLDGGHVARAALGQRHELWSKRLHVALPVLGVVVGGVMAGIALHGGASIGKALHYAEAGVLPWVVWAILLAVIRGRSDDYHPPVGDTPLDRTRVVLAWGVAIVFVVIFTFVPFREVLA